MLQRAILSFIFFYSCIMSGIFCKDTVSQPIKNIDEQQLQLIITSYNNADWYKQNLDSVFMQQYSNYKVIYIDDCSTDNTADLVEQYIAENNQQDKWTVIKNASWQSQMANHYKAVHMCSDDVICIHLDGDDWLCNDQVFNIINQTYANTDVWLTCGRPIFSCSGQKWSKMPEDILENAITKNSFRNLPFWPFTHLRTFRASLFKAIKLQDLLYKGTFTLMSPAPDLAFMLPMVEMAGRHMRILDEDLYVYNTKNSLSQFALNNEKVFTVSAEIYSWNPYQCIDALKKPVNKIGEIADALLLLSGNIDRDIILCSSVEKGKFGTIVALYPPDYYSEENILALQKQFSSIRFYQDSERNSEDIKNYINDMGAYVLVISDTSNDICENDLDKARVWLEKTQADSYAFSPFVTFKEDDKRVILLEEGVYACQPTFVQDLVLTDRVKNQIFRKNVLIKFLDEKLSKGSFCAYVKDIYSYIAHERSVTLFSLDKA